MIYLKKFSELSKNDAAIAGGKGASLGEMTKAGVPVPPGFVVSAGTFDKFLELAGIDADIDTIISKVNHHEIHAVEQASKEIQAIILNSSTPKEIELEIKTEFKKLKTKYVAVRSSATAEDSNSAAWAGQLDSFLNTNEENLLDNVKKCWASLFTPRAIFYRFEKELHNQKISVAVVVQKMVESEVSGIAFSVHPVTEDYNQIIIEAGFGLGEAIVSGQITPDSYVIAKDNLKILDKNIYTQERGIYRSKDNKSNDWINIDNKKGSSQCLSDEQILELSKLIIGIENHYGFPCDIEWAMEGGDFYIVQSRPITTLNKINERQLIAPQKYLKQSSYIKKGINYREIKEKEKLTLYLERKDLSVFVSTISHLLEGPEMKKIIGAGWGKQIFVMKDNTAYWLRNPKEIKNNYKIHAKNIENKSEDKFNSLIEKCLYFNENTDKYIKEIKETKDLSFFSNIDKFLSYFKDVLMYTTCLPYFLLESTKSKQLSKFRKNKIIESMEKVRRSSHYMSFQDVFLTRLSQYLQIQKGLSKEEVLNISYREVLLIARGKKFVDNNLSNRNKLAVIWFDKNADNDFISYDEEVFNYFVNNYLDLSLAHSDEIKGNIANKGFSIGTAVIVNSINDLSKVKDGNIIISRNTNPSIMPALIKCSAIVTDEGGIACHAAIVSRELNKPCIIGTKFATRIICDGDEVEVDANKGVVRIIKSVK